MNDSKHHTSQVKKWPLTTAMALVKHTCVNCIDVLHARLGRGVRQGGHDWLAALLATAPGGKLDYSLMVVDKPVGCLQSVQLRLLTYSQKNCTGWSHFAPLRIRAAREAALMLVAWWAVYSVVI